jgi:RND family efflux transporter MFP subunit
LISVFIAAGTVYCSVADAQEEEETASSVVATRVVQREVNTAHRVVGTVMPIRKSVVGSAVDGRVVQLLVDQGDAVKQGAPLAQLRTGTLEIELAAAKAELDVYQQELFEKLNGSRPEEISEAKARMLAAQAVKKNSKLNLERMERLYATNSTSAVDLDDARESATAAAQSYLATEAYWKRIETGPRAEQIARAKAQVALQSARVRLIEDRIEKFTIRAPFDGFVTVEHTDVGEWIQQGDPVADIIGLDFVEVQANVPAEHAIKLQRGRPIRIEFPELPGNIFTGIVERVVPTADLRTRTFPVNIRLENRFRDGRPMLMAGMLARADLPTGHITRLPLVPKDALVLDGSRRSVFIAKLKSAGSKFGTVRAVPVRLGVADGTLIQIDAAVHDGDLVVVLGNERLKDGQDVEISRIISSDASSAE